MIVAEHPEVEIVRLDLNYAFEKMMIAYRLFQSLERIEVVSKDTLNALVGYHWPGNVRELESVIERAVITSQGTALQVMDRFDTFPKTGKSSGQEVKALSELEHDHILLVLQQTGWRIEGKNGAATLLGLNASTLRARMRKFGIARQ